MSIKCQIIVSEDLEVQQIGQGQLHKIVNSVLKMRVPFIPGGLTFAISIITSGIDFGQNHTFEISVIDSTIQESDRSRKLYSTGIQQMGIMTNNSDNFNFNVDLKNIPFLREGIFEVVFEFDKDVYTQEFEVVANKLLKQD